NQFYTHSRLRTLRAKDKSNNITHTMMSATRSNINTKHTSGSRRGGPAAKRTEQDARSQRLESYAPNSEIGIVILLGKTRPGRLSHHGSKLRLVARGAPSGPAEDDLNLLIRQKEYAARS
ncbi:MAG: hypothetical protein P4M11_10335, partial [Candidatus Pacebacteria bacterium]|nr:hypothetical protein [Candidatus Paceibacterota bacterium]